MNQDINQLMTPRECAIDFVRAYFERGDTIEQLAAGQMGYWGKDYRAQIGGWVLFHDEEDERFNAIKRDEVAITRIRLQDCLHRYKLKDLQAEIKTGMTQMRLL